MTMAMHEFVEKLDAAGNFKLRRTVERLREGLFDPLGVRLLTAHETQLKKTFDLGVRLLDENQSPHLGLCGSYGQGKSHSLTYIKQRALEQGFVTSQIDLDPREIPLHDFRQVYRVLLNQISFPDNSISLVKWWKDWALGQKVVEKSQPGERLEIIPESMPHFFKAVLTALARDNMVLSQREKALKQHRNFRPREFPWVLANALNGNPLSLPRLRQALRYREVSFYKEAPLTCKGWEPYFQMVCSLAEMFRKAGFKGWVVLFDEGESIVQRGVNIRRKSYAVLNRLLCPDSPSPGLYPIFAFTDDFFMQVQREDYTRIGLRNQPEAPYFATNYADAWQS
ncbi:DUF2791 family P-loop domain-containing protein, partial [bacterium]|nr:DUF2791 family P-loop domain-containing protein [bacterium]